MSHKPQLVIALPLLFYPFLVNAAAPVMDEATLIKSALSAAPANIADKATVKDWDDRTLREGSNGWTCYPDMNDTPGNDPMCLDGPWVAWAQGWMSKTTPKVDMVGVAYMLMGVSDASNDDPFAKTPKAGETWLSSPPHIMIVVPDPKQLDGMSSDPNNGGPWVMYKGTPYAHIMAPVK